MLIYMTTMREAVTRYFEDNGFGEDGGYSAKWVDFKLGPIPFPLPNSDARREAVKFHDLNHVLTGYRTDFGGECEISAWELGAGCREYVAAWILNLGGTVAGLWFQPRLVWRAFVAGRRSRHAAYAMNYEYAMARDVQDVRDQLGVTVNGKARVEDAVLFAAAILGGVIVGALMTIVLVSPVTLGLWWVWRRRRGLSLESAPHPAPAGRGRSATAASFETAAAQTLTK